MPFMSDSGLEFCCETGMYYDNILRILFHTKLDDGSPMQLECEIIEMNEIIDNHKKSCVGQRFIEDNKNDKPND